MKPNETIWAITATALAALESLTQTLTLTSGSYWEEYCAEIADEKFAARFDARSGLLALPIQGVLLRGADAEMECFWGCYDTRRIDAAASFAASDPRVKSFALIWDSPGGYCQGMSATFAAFDRLRAARPDLPIGSIVNGMACSLAYLFANAAGRIEAVAGSTIGSIGVMAVTTDYSKMFAAAGIEKRLFADGIYKGMGTIGVAWSDEWYKAVEDRIAELSVALRSGITAARPAVKEADMQGQTWEVENAPTALFDGITSAATLEDWLEDFAARRPA